jgi:hypothetical protein
MKGLLPIAGHQVSPKGRISTLNDHAAVLMHEVPDLLGDRRRFDEELIRRVGPPLARPGEVDHRIDQHIGDMDALGPDLARDRLG